MLKKVLSFLPILAILAFVLGSFTPVAATDEVPTQAKFYIEARVKVTPKYVWTIDKVGDASSLILSPGQSQLVNYSVTVNASMMATNGLVGVNFGTGNRSAEAMVVKSVSFTLGGEPKSFNCPTTLPATVQPGTQFNCQFPGGGMFSLSTSPVDAVATFVTDGGGLGNDITTTLTKTIDLTQPTDTEAPQDECITVTDTYAGTLGTVCVGVDTLPKTFTYSRTITAGSGECGTYHVPNTATFTTNDSLTTGSDSWNVDYTVNCTSVCSLTPGYWKTHSSFGPAPYDSTWALLGENTTFFLSGKTYYQVLWTAPQGNAYYILAHAYIAAKLNQLNGADTSVISSQLAHAETFFLNNTPTTSLTRDQRNAVIATASVLDNYNNGYIGPGHCSE